MSGRGKGDKVGEKPPKSGQSQSSRERSKSPRKSRDLGKTKSGSGERDADGKPGPSRSPDRSRSRHRSKSNLERNDRKLEKKREEMSATSTKMDLPVKTKPTGEKGNIKSCIHCSRWVGRAEYPNNGVIEDENQMWVEPTIHQILQIPLGQSKLRRNRRFHYLKLGQRNYYSEGFSPRPPLPFSKESREYRAALRASKKTSGADSLTSESSSTMTMTSPLVHRRIRSDQTGRK